MAVQRLATGDTPEIVVQRAEGDLVVRGWNQGEVVVKGEGARIEQRDNLINVQLDDSGTISVPVGSRLRIEKAVGSVVVSGVGGAVDVQKVESDLVVRDSGPLRVESVENDCTVRAVRGDCYVQHVGNDASFAFIAGDLNVENVGNDLAANNVRGSLHVAAGDDITLRLMLTPGHFYTARAGNDLSCRIQNEANATVEVAAGNKLRLRRLNTPETVQGKQGRFKLGAGSEEAQLTLAAGDDLVLLGTSLEELGDVGAEIGMDMGLRAAELVQQFTTQFEAQVGAFAKTMDEKISHLGNNEEIASRVQEKILAAARKAEEKIGEAMKKMESRQRESDRRGGGAAWTATWNPGWQGQPPPPKAPSAPPQPPQPPQPMARTSEEERLAVLKMVSEGKISIEQAEKLFAALDGRNGGAPSDR